MQLHSRLKNRMNKRVENKGKICGKKKSIQHPLEAIKESQKMVRSTMYPSNDKIWVL